MKLVLSAVFLCAAATEPLLGAAEDGLQLDAAEVTGLITRAAQALDAQTIAVAVTDRAGRPLGVYRKSGATDEAVETALSLARTGAFFSNNQAPLSSRTVQTISSEHFPDTFPGLPMLNTPAAAAFPAWASLPSDFRARISEQMAAQQLRLVDPGGAEEPGLYYWQREGGRPGPSRPRARARPGAGRAGWRHDCR